MAAQLTYELVTTEYRAWYFLPCGRVYCAACKVATGARAERFSAPVEWHECCLADICDNCGGDMARSIEIADAMATIEHTTVKIF